MKSEEHIQHYKEALLFLQTVSEPRRRALLQFAATTAILNAPSSKAPIDLLQFCTLVDAMFSQKGALQTIIVGEPSDLSWGLDWPAQSSVAPDGSPSVAPEAGAPSSAPRVNAGIGQTPEGDGGDGKDGQ